MYLLRFGRALFREKRLLFDVTTGADDSAGESVEEEEKTPEDKALQLLAAINDVEEFEGGDDPASVLKNNPYAETLFTFVKNFKDEEFAILQVDHIPGRLTLRYQGREVHVFGEVYNAIYWKEIKAKLDHAFAGRNVSDSLMHLSHKNSKRFRDLVDYLAGDPAVIETSRIDTALAEMEGLRGKLRTPEAGKKLGKVKSEVEFGKARADFKRTMRKAPIERILNEEDFMKKVNDPKRKEKFNRLTVNTNREQTKINVEKWDHMKGIDQIYDDCYRLGIINQDPQFYNTMFAILRNAADKKTNKHLLQGKEAMFQDPANPANREDILAIPPDGTFWGGEQFIAAYDHLLELQGTVLGQDQYQESVGEGQRKLDEDPIADKVTDFVQRNLATFKKAIREKDYATAGMYAIGIYALYKAYKKIAGTENGGKIKNWIMYGAAAYAGTVFAKNAGYDILKMAGFRDEDYEVKGTPMEVMRNILSNNPQLWEKTKDIDYGIVMRMSSVNLVTLDDLFQKSNNDKVQFIHPKDLRSIFSDLAPVWSFEMGQRAGYTGMSNNKLSAKQEEYIRVGQQLYKIALGLRGVYNETLRKDGAKEFKGVKYEVAIRNKDVKMAHMWQLFDAASPWSAMSPDNDTFNRRKQQDIEESLQEAFVGKKQEGAYINRLIGEGDYLGQVKGFPVVFSTAKEGYRVYLMNNYNDGEETYTGNPGGDFITVMPFEGKGREVAAGKVVAAVDARMKELIKPFMSPDGKSLVDKTLTYDSGEWRCKVQYQNAGKFDVVSVPQDAVIEPDITGKAVYLTTKIGGLRIKVDEDLAKQDDMSLVVIPKLVNQKEFHALRILSYAGKLKIEDVAGSKESFILKVGDKIKVKMKYASPKAGAPKKFDFESPAEEEALLRDGSGFADELRDALSQDADLKKAFENWKKLIEETDEDYFVNFFRHVPEWFTKATVSHPARGFSLSHFTGSIPKNYTYALLETQKEFLLSKVANSIYSTKTLAGVSDKVDSVFSPAVRAWNDQMLEFSKLTTKKTADGDDWSAEAFNDRVFGQLAEVGIRSNEYKVWYRQFVEEIFTRQGGSWDDIREGKSIKARDVAKVFAHFTSAVDDPEIDGVDFNLVLTTDDAEKVKIIREIQDAAAGKTMADADVFKAANKKNPTLFPKADSAKIGEAIALTKQQVLAEKFHYHSNYVNYVAERIFLKINNGDLKSRSVVPGPTSFWEIEPYHVWKQNPILARYNFVDKEPPLRMRSDYITLDKYYKLPKKEKEKILKTRRQDIILPREDIDFTLITDPSNPNYLAEDAQLLYETFGVKDKAELQDLMKIDTVTVGGTVKLKPRHELFTRTNKFRLTDTEKLFFETFQNALKKIEKDYPGKTIPEKFTELRNNYSLNMYVDTVTPIAGGAKIGYKFQQNKELADRVKKLEEKWSIGTGKRMTKSEQVNAVKIEVERILENTVMNSGNFDTYFNDPSIKDIIVEKAKNIWAWLW